MIKKIISILFISYFSVNLFAQVNSEFDILYNYCIENKTFNPKETLFKFKQLETLMLNDTDYLHQSKMYYLNFIIQKKNKNRAIFADTLFESKLKPMDSIISISNLINLSNILISQGNTKRSIELLNKAVELCEKTDSLTYKNSINISLAEAYRKDYEYEKALVLLKSINYSNITKKDLANAYSRTSAIYNECRPKGILNKNDSVEKYSLLCLKIAKEINDTLLVALSQNELGFLYLNRKIDYNKAEAYLLSILENLGKLNNNDISVLINISNLYLNKKENKKSLDFILRGFEHFSYKTSEETSMRFFLQLANVYSHNHLNYFAYQYSLLGRKIQLELLNSKIEANSLELAAKYDLKIKQFEIDKITQQNIKEKQRTFIAVLLLSISIVVLVLIFFNNKLKSKLQQQKEENLILENDILIKKNKYRSQKLSQALANIARQNSMMSAIKVLLKSGQTNSAISTINANFNIENNWQNLYNDFSEIYPNFFEHLEKKHADITENEKRLSALLMMNLKSQEIADILSVTLSTINKNRQRLRKKLNLSQNSDITYYLKTEIDQ